MRFSVYLLFLLMALGVLGQENTSTQSLRGIVRDAETQKPIPGTNITVLDHDGMGTMADDRGEFKLHDLPVGRYDIRASFLGYKASIKHNVLIQSGKELYLEFELVPMVEQLDEVVIKAYYNKNKPINKMASVSARSFNKEETERYAGALGDPSRMAQNFAGVISAGDQRNDIIIRGNSPTGLLWRLDGVPIPNPNHFGAMGSTGGPVSMLNNNLLTNSDFFTGAFPAEYGDAISGVFDLNMRHGNNTTRQHVFQVGFNGFELGTEGPFSKKGRSTYLLNYRYSTLGVMDALGIDVAGGGVPQYQDLSFKVHFPTKKTGTFSFTGIGGTSHIVFEQDADNDNTYGNTAGVNTRNGSDMGTVLANHLYFINENTRIKTHVSASAYQVQTTVDSLKYADDNQSEIEKEILYFKEQNREYRWHTGTKLTSKINNRNVIETGLNVETTLVNYLDSALSHIDTIGGSPFYTYNINTDVEGDYLNLLQIYAQWKHKFSDQLTLYSGLHGQYLEYNGSHAIEPRTNLSYELAPQHTLSAGYGLHSMMQPGITYFTQNYIDSTNTYVFSNKNLDFTKSHHAVLAYDFVITPDLRFKAETYYQYLYDIPVRSVFSNVNFGAGFNFPRIDSLKNEGLGRNYGIEFTLEKFLSKSYYFLITASLFESEFKNPDGQWRNTAFNNQYVINTLGGIELPLNDKTFVNFNVKTVLAGGNPLMSIDEDASEANNYTVYDYASAYVKRGPCYFRLDGRISLKLNGKKVSQEWALDVQNITNHKNVFNQTYDQSNGEVVYNYQQGFFPMFLYRLNF